MNKLLLATLAALTVFLASGCGSLVNLFSKDPVAFGGIQKDAEAIQQLGSSSLNINPPINPKAALFLLALVPTEMCLSVCLDTVTLPVTLYRLRHWPPPEEPIAYTADPCAVGDDCCPLERAILGDPRTLPEPAARSSLSPPMPAQKSVVDSGCGSQAIISTDCSPVLDYDLVVGRTVSGASDWSYHWKSTKRTISDDPGFLSKPMDSNDCPPLPDYNPAVETIPSDAGAWILKPNPMISPLKQTWK